MKLDSSVKVGETAKITVPVTNTGSRDGEEVVQVYLKKDGETDGPIKTLRASTRTHPGRKDRESGTRTDSQTTGMVGQHHQHDAYHAKYLRCIGRWKLSRERPAKENTKTVIRNR